MGLSVSYFRTMDSSEIKLLCLCWRMILIGQGDQGRGHERGAFNCKISYFRTRDH